MEREQSFTFMDTYPLHHYRMANGLEVFLLHNPISPVVTYLTHYTVGSASEQPGERGLAHFFEHMMFRETKTLQDGEFDRVMAEAGGVGLNAYTSYDTTAYYVNVPILQIDRVIELEADRMVNLRLSPELIEAERGAVLGEMRMYMDMPSEQFWHKLMAEAFPGHPYRHPIIGYAEQVQGFQGEDFHRFYHSHYAPNRAIVVIAGGFDEEELLPRLERTYGALEPGVARPDGAPADPPWTESRRLEITHPKITTESVMIAARTPGLTHTDTPALVLLAALLSGGQSSPLYRAIVLDGLGTLVSAGALETEMMLASPGLFLIDVTLKHQVAADRAEAAVVTVLDRLEREGIPQEELERALNQMRLNVYASLRTNTSMARQIGGFAVACGDPLFGQRLLAAIEQVTREDLLRVLTQYLTGAPRLTVVQRPGEGESA